MSDRDSFDDEPTYETPEGAYPPPSWSSMLHTIGDAVMNKVNDAVDAADFAGLSSSISGTIKNATDMLSQSMAKPSPYIVHFAGKKSTALVKATVFGLFALGNALMSLAVLFFSVIFGFGDIGSVVLLVIFAALTVAFGMLTFAVYSDRQLFATLDSFARIAGQREQVSIEELSANSGISMRDATMRLERAIREGYIPHGRIRATVEGQTMLFLTDGAWRRAGGTEPTYIGQTAEAIHDQQVRAQRQEEAMRQAAAQRQAASQQAASRQAASQQAAPQQSSYDQRVATIVFEGSSYLDRIARAKEVIANDQMSAKLTHLEGVVRRIIDRVQTNPKSADQLRQFTSYYLPTTSKLIDAYVDLEARGEHGPNAEMTRKEIQDTLDVINSSFDKLADDLLQDKTWDLQGDMHVLRTMLAQDGLTDDGGPRADSRRKAP